MVSLILLSFVALFTAIYFYMTRKFNYWQVRKVPALQPTPFLGNFGTALSFKKNLAEWLQDIYQFDTNSPFVGFFVFDRPYLMLREPELIKDVMIKDFASFHDRNAAQNVKGDLVGTYNLFSLKHPDWKMLRNKLTPVFTSGKMKLMYPLMSQVGKDLQKYIGANSSGSLKAKEISSNYSTDVISSCVLGVDAKSFSSKEDSELQIVGKRITDFSLKRAIHMTAIFFSQTAVNLFNFKLFEPVAAEIMRKIFWEVLTEREAKKFKRGDLIDILVELRKKEGDNDAFQGDKLVAQACVFFSAGFETTSTTMAFTLYELSLQPRLQERLRTEILTALKESNGEIGYEKLHELPYLDMCVSETLRKYPPLPFLDRKCMKNYKFANSDLTIEKGTPVFISLMGLHYDPQYFEHPQKYDPERFSEANRVNIPSGVYMPFGTGPHVCIGERFGLMSTKCGLVHILSQFRVEKTAETPVPVVFDPKGFLLSSPTGLPLKFTKIN